MAKPTTSTRSRPKASAKTAAKTGANRRRAPTKKPAPVVVTETLPVVSAPELKKRELIDEAVERSGIKKKFAKPAIEAALAILGEALADDRDLNLRPMGKLKVQRSKDVANGKVIQARIRQPLAQVDNSGDDPLADAAE